MATNTVQNPAILCNHEIAIETLHGKPAIVSKELSLRFQKKHNHVLRDIERIRSQVPRMFFQSNFGQMFTDTNIGNGAIRQDRVYLLTRDAFSLLAMGFTGKAAILWKLKYIEAFNALEQGVIGQASEIEQLTKEKQAYLTGLQEGKRLQKKQDGLVSVEKALGYIDKGLKITEAAKLIGMSHHTLSGRLSRLRRKLT